MDYNRKIGIIGQGFVGNAVYQKFKKYFDILTFDTDSKLANSTYEELTLLCDVIFLCLPTPMNDDGSCHINIVEDELNKLNEGKYIVVIKSTVPPGTVEKWNKEFKNLKIVFNPEFLTERNAVDDFNNQNRIILGGPRPATTKLKQIYSKVFPNAHIIKTGSTHAEMVKYFTNCFLALKVSFANEMFEITKNLNLDYDKVVEYATLDKRLGKSHWAVPGPDGDFGYGGHCFPKDVKALIKLAEHLGIHPKILNATDSKNEDVRKFKDWTKMKGRAVV
jgi:UDPglucose 6-dehydrogenase